MLFNVCHQVLVNYIILYYTFKFQFDANYYSIDEDKTRTVALSVRFSGILSVVVRGYNSTFTYARNPVVNSISISQGPLDGGTDVTLTGSFDSNQLEGELFVLCLFSFIIVTLLFSDYL